jgi:hypothetical protein
MTGNELDVIMTANPPWNPSHSIAEWLQGTGANVVELRARVAALQQDLDNAKKSRARLVEAMAELQALLGLPYPDPARIVRDIKNRIGKS